MDIIEELKRIRKKKHLTQNELGELAGVAYSTISDIETGKASPTLTLVEKLARVLGCELCIKRAK